MNEKYEKIFGLSVRNNQYPRKPYFAKSSQKTESPVVIAPA